MHMRSFLFSLAVCLITTSCVWNDPENDADFLPLDDSEYPFANLPRLVIETEGFKQIRDRETKIPARLQIWGKDKPESEVLDLTIRGRGNSSFEMTKFSYKIKLENKQDLFGMPADKEWDLVSNFRDKSQLRNAITYQLSKSLNVPYSPQFHFVELFINREYRGVYFFVEHVKVSKNRVNLPKDNSSFLIEKTSKKDVAITPFGSSGNYVNKKNTRFFETEGDNLFKIEFPKESDDSTLNLVKNQFRAFEKIMKSQEFEDTPIDTLERWINVQDFIRYYWIQEFSKNIDGAFRRSIFLTWCIGGPIQMGPVWDFDLAYGIGNTTKMSPKDFYVRTQNWYKKLFQNKAFKQEAQNYWKQNHQIFATINDSIPYMQKKLQQAIINDEKRWPILDNAKDWPFIDSYPNYDSAVDSLKNWISQRIGWISSHI